METALISQVRLISTPPSQHTHTHAIRPILSAWLTPVITFSPSDITCLFLHHWVRKSSCQDEQNNCSMFINWNTPCSGHASNIKCKWSLFNISLLFGHRALVGFFQGFHVCLDFFFNSPLFSYLIKHIVYCTVCKDDQATCAFFLYWISFQSFQPKYSWNSLEPMTFKSLTQLSILTWLGF